MKNRILILGGALAPIIYIVASIIGGLLLPEYSHIKDSVCDLLRTGAPNKALLDTLMIISNLLTILGCYGVIVTHKKNMNRLVNAGVILMLVAGVLSFLSSKVFILPTQDEMTISGIIHITIVGVSALITMVVTLLIGFVIHKHEGWKFFKIYSIITFLVIFISGGLSPVIAAKGIPLMGLFERLAVGAYFQWVIVLFVKFYNYMK